MRRDLALLRATILLALTAGAGCSGTKDTDGSPSDDADADTDADSDTDTDTDTDADSDADADTDTDADADADTDADSDTDTDTDPPVTCTTQLLDSRGVWSGLVECSDGSIDRQQAVTCDPTIPLPVCSSSGSGTPTYPGACETNADCTARPNGVCSEGAGFYGVGCDCVYPCSNDSDCNAGEMCLCGGTLPQTDAWSECAPATCLTDSACASGECGVALATDAVGCPFTADLDCRTSNDQCRSDSDCSGAHEYCGYKDGPGRWECIDYSQAACGRPLRVDGAARHAPAARRGDWADAVPLGTPVEDAVLAAYWTRIGAMEHASVASFARVTLQLMALGAPADLLVATHRAAVDEIEHARLTYGLARGYGAEEVGPGPLPLHGMVVDTDRRAVVEGLITEACVAETVAVAEVREAARLAVDPALRQVLERIADDEQRHAALAWRTLRWLLEGADAADRAAAAETFAAAIAEMRSSPVSPLHVPEHGIIGGTAQGRLRTQVLSEVIAPAVATLLGAETSNRPLSEHLRS